MTRTGADGVVAQYLPEGMDIYLGYVDGKYLSFDALRARFPGKLIVPIATQPGGNVGTVGDGPGDNGTWPEWIGWVRRRRAAGVDPTIYTNQSLWTAGINAFNAAKVAQPHWWIANWNGQASMIPGTIGHQYKEVTGRYDLSIFADYWPGVDPAPGSGGGGSGGGGGGSIPTPTPTTPTLRRVKDMMLCHVIKEAGQDPGIWLLSGALYVHMSTPADVTALRDQGVGYAQISLAQHTEFLGGYQSLTKASPVVHPIATPGTA